MEKENIKTVSPRNQEMCPKCLSLKNKGEGKGMFPVLSKHYVCCDCGLIFHTMSSYYLRRYKEVTGEYWNNDN